MDPMVPGFGLIFLAAVCGGAFALPLRLRKRFAVENTMLVAFGFATLVFPLIFVSIFVPTWLQALGMLNGQFINDQAKVLAARLRSDAGEDPAAQVRHGLRLVTSRQATDEEILWGVQLMQRLQQDDRVSPQVALEMFCLMALNLNEFVFID